VLAALAENPTAWKECARWKYFRAILPSALKKEKERSIQDYKMEEL
jgi:hypothetical protein